MTALDDLIERAEKATGPDRNLDAMIYWQINNGVGVGTHSSAPPFTASLDAALSLVPEGWGPSLRIFSLGNAWAHMYGEAKGISGATVEARHNVPAIALVIASLKAKANVR